MARKALGPRLTPAKAKNLLGVAKVVGPVLIPVLAPFAVKAAGLVSDKYDHYRARRLGVDIEDLTKYTGRGAKLHARIAGFAQALEELRAKDPDYVTDTESRLLKLAAAVRAAERMPTQRRKAAHRAVGNDLNNLETDLLRRLGVS
jgi:hypothetical protein